MRITKKVVSLVLAILMVTTMMSVMAVSASALDVTVVNLSDLTESYVIIEGGNYQFTGVSTLAKPVIINTTEAVTIQDSTIVTTKTGDTGYAVTVIAADSNVTIKDSTLKSYARAIEYDFDVTPQTGTLTVDNTTMVTYGLEEENYTTTLVNGGSATKRAVNFGKVKINATFTDSTFAGYHYAINFTQQAAGANSTVTATNCKFYARAALNNWAPNLTATFNSCTVYAINNFGGSSESFAAFVVYDGADNTKVYLNNTEVIASYNGAGVTNANAVNNLLDVRGNNCTIEANDSSYTDTTNKGSIVSEDNVLEYLLDGDTNTVIINGGTYDCNFPETYDASAYAAYISDPDIDASNVSITQFYANVIEVQDGTFSADVPVEYLDNTKETQHNSETGKYEVVNAETPFAVRIGSNRYTSYAGAIAALQDNDTIVLLADTGDDLWSGPSINGKKNITLELNGKTLKQRFNVFNSELTIKDSSDEQTGAITCTNWIELRGANLTIESGTFNTEFSDLYSNNPSSVTVKGGTFNGSAYEGLISLGGDSSTIKIEGGTFKGISRDYQDTILMRAGYIYIYGGDMSNNHTRVNVPHGTVSTSIYGGKFHNAVPAEYCASGYVPTGKIDNSYYTVEYVGNPLDKLNTPSASINDGNAFGIKTDYLMGTLIGVQKKTVAGEDTSSQEGTNNMRFVACLDTTILQNADDYGFVVAKVDSTKNYSNTNIDALVANWGNGEKTVSAKDTYNNVCGTPAYGDPTDDTTDYKYITCAINDVTNSDKFVVRFYVKTGGKYYYAKYSGHDYKYTGCIAAWSDLG